MTVDAHDKKLSEVIDEVADDHGYHDDTPDDDEIMSLGADADGFICHCVFCQVLWPMAIQLEQKAEHYDQLILDLYKYTEDSPDEHLAEFLSGYLGEGNWPPVGVPVAPDVDVTKRPFSPAAQDWQELADYLTVTGEPMPTPSLYHIINTTYSIDGYACFWADEGAGYTRDVEKAGRFGIDYCLSRRHNKDLVFLPVDALEPNMTVEMLPTERLNQALGGDALPVDQTAVTQPEKERVINLEPTYPVIIESSASGRHDDLTDAPVFSKRLRETDDYEAFLRAFTAEHKPPYRLNVSLDSLEEGYRFLEAWKTG